jgi:hypothetical protein
MRQLSLPLFWLLSLLLLVGAEALAQTPTGPAAAATRPVMPENLGELLAGGKIARAEPLEVNATGEQLWTAGDAALKATIGEGKAQFLQKFEKN